MYRNFNTHRFLVLILGMFFAQQNFAMNWLRPYDVILRPDMHWEKPWTVAAWAETGIKPALGFNSDNQRVNVLQIWNPDQDAIAMLNGFDPSTLIGQTRIALNTTDIGTRGHFCVTGQLHEIFRLNVGAYYKFRDYFWVAAYLPFMGEKLTNVNWIDQTQSITADDLRVKQEVTNNIFSNVALWGDGLQLGGWKRQGLGDLLIMVEWFKKYPQRREILKNVILNWAVGLSFPTGLKTNPDLIMALPFGYDGAYAIIFAGQLQLILGDIFKIGMDIHLTHHFGTLAERRIKTWPDQTELLLLAKTPAYKDYGLEQFFSLWGTLDHVLCGLSATVGYQFLKKGADTLQLKDCTYSNNIANTSIILRDWTVHQAIIKMSYDAGYHMRQSCVWPQFSFFLRIPFNGSRSAAFTTAGGMIAIEF